MIDIDFPFVPGPPVFDNPGEELRACLEECIGSPITQRSLEEIHRRIRFILDKHGLKDLLFRFHYEEGSSNLYLLGIRPIDKYALGFIIQEVK